MLMSLEPRDGSTGEKVENRLHAVGAIGQFEDKISIKAFKDLGNYDVDKDSIFGNCSFIIIAEAAAAPLQELLILWLLDENCNVKRKSRFQS